MTLPTYSQFLWSKLITAEPAGFTVPADHINSQLFGFQRDIVNWALVRGRAAVFADCGLGKTPIQLEWARHVSRYTGGRVLIFAPLAVAEQTRREGAKFGVPVTICRSQRDVRDGVNITNYERLGQYRPDDFLGTVLDESSILKSYDGVFRQAVTDFAAHHTFRLACTATPAPNDIAELTNHAEFLSIMSGKEILALFFIQDGNTTHRWRLKGHAQKDFWAWVASWSVAVRKPSDLGHADGAFVLPPLKMHQEVVTATGPRTTLFALEAQTLQERMQARRDSIRERVQKCADLVNASTDPWIVWCNLNAESAALTGAISDAVEVRGSDSIDRKEQALLDFSLGKTRVMVTKPTIAGHGMNWQHCANMAFVGLSDSYEQLYQAIRRCWRFGQTRPVHCYIITADTEGAVVDNIARKERSAMALMDEIVANIRATGLGLGRARREIMKYEKDCASGGDWTMYLGDAVDVMDGLESNAVGLSVFSPPFPGMYAYTNSPRDMGNVRDINEMIRHFSYLVGRDKLLRITMPGRSCCVHLTQGVAFKGQDGYIGLKDFRGAVIQTMEEAGWIYYGEVCIEKDPQVKAIRTKDAGLLFKSLASDSARMHMALADYLIQFRKPGENPCPVRAGVSARYANPDGWITSDEWIEWAAPVWYRKRPGLPGGIKETDVLNVRDARGENDEKHLCPLQLGVIERAIKLWSNPGDLICDPFAGIASVGVVAKQLRRRFVGIELKRSYWDTACRYLRMTGARGRDTLFSGVA